MKKIAIYGAGGFGREVAWMLNQINRVKPTWEVIGYFDDARTAGERIGALPVLGGISVVNSWKEELSMAVAVANPVMRMELIQKINNDQINYPTLIHPNCDAGDPINQFGKGCILTAGCILTTSVTLHDFVIINIQATVGHDVVLGSYTTVMPGSSISGNVQIGASSMIGAGARVLQNLRLGHHIIVGAGAVVTKDAGDNKTLLGIPANEK
ncbi:MAG: acetyltransferase [Cyclobacteriaceae bacterium]